METIFIRRGEVERLLREAGISQRKMRSLIGAGQLVPRYPEILRAKRAYYLRAEVKQLIGELGVRS
jgi:hypothetical protein